jgi:hypothetical protein
MSIPFIGNISISFLVCNAVPSRCQRSCTHVITSIPANDHHMPLETSVACACFKESGHPILRCLLVDDLDVRDKQDMYRSENY